MLIRARDLFGFAIRASDGKVGRVRDLQIDDHLWAVRDIVVDVGHWLTGRMALISPACIVGTDCVNRNLRVSLTAEQIAEAPGIESHPAVTRQHRVEPYNYLGIPACWGAMDEATGELGTAMTMPQRIDPCLRSLRELSHYRLEAHDGQAGRIRDWLVDDRAWMTRYAVVRTAGVWPGKEVLVPVNWLGPVSYTARVVHADLNGGAIVHAPDFEAASLSDARYETRLLAWYDGPSRRPASRR